MVEVLEYAVVFGVTSLLAGFSLLVLQGSLPVVRGTQGSAEFDELNGAVSSAAVEGTATVFMPLSNASIGCSSGVLTFSSGASSYSSQVGYPCDFAFTGVSCSCKLVFSTESDVLMLRVES